MPITAKRRAAEGNAFFLLGFPKLDYIERRLVEGEKR